MSAAVRIREQVAAFSAGQPREAGYLRALKALLRERKAIGELTLTIWGGRQKPPLVGTEAERLMNLLVNQGVAKGTRRDINAPLVWRLSPKAKCSEAQAPEASAKDDPQTSHTEQASPSPAKALVPSRAPDGAPRRPSPPVTTPSREQAETRSPGTSPFSAEPTPEPEETTAPTVPLSEEPILIAGDAACDSAPSVLRESPGLALAPSPVGLLRSLPPTGPLLPPRPDASPTALSPMPPSGEETPLHQLTSEVVLKLGLSLRDRERLGQQLIAIGQLLRGDLKPNLGLQGLSESTARVFQAMSTTPETPVQIARRLGMDGQQVSNAIKTLSLRSLVVRVAHGLWRLA